VLDLEITTHCNLRCRWCFVGEVRPERRHMSLELATRVLEEAAFDYGPRLHLSGGEPMLYPELRALLSVAAGCGYTDVLINTNGTLLDHRRLIALEASPLRVELAVSLDGRQADHEFNRGPSSFETTVESMTRALDHGLPVRVLTIVTRDSVRRLDDFLDWLDDTVPGIQGVYLIPVGDVSRGKAGSETAPLGPSEIVALGLCSAARLLGGRTVRVLDYPVVNLVYRALGLPVTMVGSKCGACRDRTCVQADGSITPCHPVWTPLGTYRPGALHRARTSELYRRIAQRRFDGCDTCPDKAICGHCRAAVLANTGRLFGNDWICAAVRQEISRRGLGAGRLPLPGPKEPLHQRSSGSDHVAV